MTVRRWSVLARGYHIAWILLTTVVAAVVLYWLPLNFVLPLVTGVLPITSPTVLLACAVVAFVVPWCAEEPATALHWSAPRHTAAHATARVVALLTFATVVLTVSSGGSELQIVTVLAALSGEGLLLAAVLGVRTAWALPTAHLVASLTLGSAGEGEIAAWAWVVRADPGAGVLSSLLVLVAGLLWWRYRRR